MTGEKFIEENKKKWDSINNHYRNNYLKENNNPDVIIEFIKKNPHAIEEDWVLNEIKKWVMYKDYDSLNRLQPQRGKRREENQYFHAIKDLMIMDKVDKLVETGISKTEAFIKVSEKSIFKTSFSPETIRNRYYKAKHRKPYIRIKETKDSITISILPTRAEVEGINVYGHATLTLNK